MRRGDDVKRKCNKRKLCPVHVPLKLHAVRVSEKDVEEMAKAFPF